MNLLNLHAPTGWRPPASRTPANSGVPAVGVFSSHTVRAVIVPRDNRFPSQLAGFVYKCVLCRGWDRILSGCRWLHEPQSISNQPMGLEFPHRAGRYRPGGPSFCPRFDEIVDVWTDFRSGDGTISSPGGSTNPGLGCPHRMGRCRPEEPP